MLAPSEVFVEKRSVGVLLFVFGGLFLALFGMLVLAFAAMQGERKSYAASPFGGGQIGVVEVKGAIMESDQTVAELHEFLEDERILAVIVRVDSPGGAVAPSQEIHDEVKRLAQKKKVVISMGNLAASGGYYLAAPATKIVANPGTITGSIGVITQIPNVSAIAEKVGFEMNTIKSGPAKDTGNPFRPFSEEDRASFQGMIDNVYAQFVRAVSEGRGIPEDKVRTFADGRAITGEQAKAFGLVDELGNFRDAVRIAAELAGIEGEPQLVYPEKNVPFSLDHLFAGGARAAVRAGAAELSSELRGSGAAAPMMYLLPVH